VAKAAAKRDRLGGALLGIPGYPARVAAKDHEPKQLDPLATSNKINKLQYSSI